MSAGVPTLHLSLVALPIGYLMQSQAVNQYVNSASHCNACNTKVFIVIKLFVIVCLLFCFIRGSLKDCMICTVPGIELGAPSTQGCSVSLYHCITVATRLACCLLYYAIFLCWVLPTSQAWVLPSLSKNSYLPFLRSSFGIKFLKFKSYFFGTCAKQNFGGMI